VTDLSDVALRAIRSPSPNEGVCNLGDEYGAVLGPAEYTAYLFSRDGKTRLKELPFTSLEWSRTIDNFSEASITIGGDIFPVPDDDVRDIIDCWKFEVGIYRNNTKVWCGPITNVEMEANSLVISAADISVWLQHRLIYTDRKFKQADLAAIASWVVADAMSVDNVPGLVANFTNTGVKGDREYRADHYLSASDELDELARTGVDWTIVNREMVVGNFEIPATKIPGLVQEHLTDDPSISIAGGAMGTAFYVIGSDPPQEDDAPPEPENADKDPGPKVVGIARGGNPKVYGVHDRVVTESAIIDTSSATANARTRLAVLGEPPIVFSNAGLVPTAPVTVDQLVPGRTVSILLSYPREARSDYRIKGVKGTWDGSTVSDIAIDLEPVGTVAIEDSL
jgi:hypothetical protein